MRFILLCTILLGFGLASARAEDASEKALEHYRAMIEDPMANPGYLSVDRGEQLWALKRGTHNVSLQTCDLGQGPGKLEGAYAHLPRYFADAGRVMDLETRLLWCMVNQQGYSEADALKNHFGNGEKRSVFETLAAYVTSKSQGVKMHVALDDPKVRDMYRLGEKMFYYRAATHDFSCASCHGADDKRIRLQDLPNLTSVVGAQKAYTTWPAYRVSQGEVRTFQWRLNDCFRQQRFPELVFGSDASIALTTYLAGRANGAPYNGPAIKR